MTVHRRCATVESRQLPGSIFFADPSLLVTSLDSFTCGRISLCTILNVARSSSSAGASLTRSVTSSIRLAWGCGHQEGLSNFYTTPRFLTNMPFPLPIFSTTLLLERGTLITSGAFSRIKPKLGLSLSTVSISTIFSVQKFSSSATS